MRAEVLIALGANLASPADTLRQAFIDLEQIPTTTLIRHSKLYRTPPMGPPGQPDYINAVSHLHTELAPRALLSALQQIEAEHGRMRDGTRWGPRTLDLDLLCYADLTWQDPQLTLPHPGIAARAFVLVPLNDIAPNYIVPNLGSVQSLHAALPPQDLESILPID